MAARRLDPQQRDLIAEDAVERYRAGETWAEIGADHGISGTHVHRLTVARHEVAYRRWGKRPVADVDEVCRRRDQGESLDEIASALDCSRQAVRTALESAGRVPQTRYPRLSTRRASTADEVARLKAKYESCPEAPRRHSGWRHIRGEEGRQLAEACLELVLSGIPMTTLSKAIGRGATWLHWLFKCHDLHPDPHAAGTTSRRTRELT